MPFPIVVVVVVVLDLCGVRHVDRIKYRREEN